MELLSQTYCHSDTIFKLVPKSISINNNNIRDIIAYHLDGEINKLAKPSNFLIRRKNKPYAELTEKEIGYLGERAFFRFLEQYFQMAPLEKAVGKYKPFSILYLNANRESFKPFDITVCDKYFDVKTTRHKAENHFHISLNEAEFILT